VRRGGRGAAAAGPGGDTSWDGHPSAYNEDVSTFDKIAGDLCALAREAHARGSVAATSGNFSAVVARDPLRVAITPSGADKGALTPDRMLEIDGDGKVLRGSGRPSAEAAVHLTLIRLRGAGAVAHTHSMWATLLSERDGANGKTAAGARSEGGGGGRSVGAGDLAGTGSANPAEGPTKGGPPDPATHLDVVIQGYEMLKALSGVTTHEHREVLPVVDNTQDWSAGVREIEAALERAPGAHGLLIRGHGLYTWGVDVAEAGRHLAALEFLLEVDGRRTWRS